MVANTYTSSYLRSGDLEAHDSRPARGKNKEDPHLNK
jgi:hypothetical protein